MENKPQFTHLHLHSEYSLLDGMCHINKLPKLAKSMEMDACGLSDHGNTIGHLKFQKACQEEGIHPVFANEMYVTPRKEWKKVDFEQVLYKDIRYISKDELECKPIKVTEVIEIEEPVFKKDGSPSLNKDGNQKFKIKKQKIVSEVERENRFPNHVKLEKKMAETFTKGDPKTDEQKAFLADLELQNKKEFDSLPKSTRWYKCAILDDRQKRLFEFSPRIGHLLVIAKNNEGYKNLLRLTSISELEGKYGKPRIDWHDIKKYSKGLVATSACVGSTIGQAIRRGKLKIAKNQIKFLNKCFDEFFLEIQPSRMPEQILVNETLIKWSEEMDIPLIATSDAHMLRPEDRPIHKAITSINRGKEDGEEDIDVYEHCCFWSVDEMLEMGMPAQALQNAYDLSHRCQVTIETGVTKYPKFEVPEGHNFDSYLRELCEKGLVKRLSQGKGTGVDFIDTYRTYKTRLDFELQVVKDKGISAYFLIVWDFINFCRMNGIGVGPGRGSAAGALLSYSIGITNVDPIKYGLLFERFLNPERMALPDIDSDISFLRRHEVIDYLNEKYGEEQVSQVATFGQMSTKTVLKDIGRALDIDHNAINELNKHIPSHQGKVMPLSEALESIKEVQTFQKAYPKLFEIALQVEGMPRSQGIHACAMIVSPIPIAEEIAQIRGKAGEQVAGADGPTMEEKGFIKLDLLGLKNVSVAEVATKLIQERYGVYIDVDNLEPDNQKAFDMIKRGETDSLFQIESPGMKKMFSGMNSVDFNDLVAGISLYRPGPMENIPSYVARKNGVEEVPSIHPKYDTITNPTFGILVYQEQAMEISKSMAGYSAGAADVLRKSIGKKKIEILEPALAELKEKMMSHGVSEDVANKACDDIRPFAGYGLMISPL